MWNRVFEFLAHILASLESVMFAIHWHELDKNSSGKLAKGAFFKSLFAQQTTFNEPNEHSTADQKKAYETALSKFRSKYGKTITYQNYLLELYDLVSLDFVLASP